MISGVAEDTNDSCFMLKFCVYHDTEVLIDLTVRTRWSREVIVQAAFLAAMITLNFRI